METLVVIKSACRGKEVSSDIYCVKCKHIGAKIAIGLVIREPKEMASDEFLEVYHQLTMVADNY